MNCKDLRIGIEGGIKHTGTDLTHFTPVALSKIRKPELMKLYTTYRTLWQSQQAALTTEAEDFSKVCAKCGGSGDFTFEHGGKGSCHQCKGKGHQDADDVQRNATYAKYHPA